MMNTLRRRSALSYQLLFESKLLNAYFSTALLFLTGCTATQVRWDATNMRKEVMVYYNDQIMDNLIRARNELPFVHVDITLLTSQGGSQISGTIGAGETRTNTNASKSMAGMLGTVTNAVMRPFTYSVSPQQTETLTITTAPALGNQAVASSSSTMAVTKETESKDSDGNITETKERNLTPKPVTIYVLYEKFARDHLSDSLVRPSDGTYVQGTLKKSDYRYYYIRIDDKEAYYEFCKKLFTKGQAGSLEKALQQTQAASFAIPAR